MGSGTVLYECARLNIHSIGSEINPAAIKMAKLYELSNIKTDERIKLLSKLELILNRYLLSISDDSNSELFNNEEVDLLYGTIKNVKNNTLKNILEIFLILLDFNYNKINRKKFFLILDKLKNIIINLPILKQPIEIIHADARNIPLENSRIDLVITSPPYINVFNYHQQRRKVLENLGWNLLHVAKSEIGSNRKHRGNRFLTVIQYIFDIHDTIKELARVSKSKARLIFIVGRKSRVRKTDFFNSEIVAYIATQCFGIKLEMRQERCFKNKFGELIYEDILHFINIKTSEKLKTSKNIASEIMNDALSRAPKDSINDLNQAINLINNVQPSLFYNV